MNSVVSLSTVLAPNRNGPSASTNIPTATIARNAMEDPVQRSTVILPKPLMPTDQTPSGNGLSTSVPPCKHAPAG
jgi:hypothetical protein